VNQPIRLAAFLSHPVQYYSPWFAELASHVDLKVYYALGNRSVDQAEAGFGVEFDWDIDLLAGYKAEFLNNVANPPQLAGFSGCDVPEVRALLSAESPDAILIFGWHKKFYWQVLVAAFFLRIPVFVRVDSQLESPRSTLKRFAKYLPYRMVLPIIAHYLSPGERAEKYLGHYGVPPSRIHRVPHMIDVSRFAEGSLNVDQVRAEHGALDDQVVLLFVGKLIEKKHPKTLIKALRELPPSVRSRFVIWYVGSGALNNGIENESESGDVEIRLLGFRNQSELPSIYAAADCLILPSDGGETWGLVVNEAMACGTPAIVSSEVGAGPDLIESGKTGWVFPFGDVASLAELLKGLTRESLSSMAPALKRKTDTFSYQTGSVAFLGAVREVLR